MLHCSNALNFCVAKILAEREGFEPPVEFPPQLLSRQSPSTGLGHLSFTSLLNGPAKRSGPIILIFLADHALSLRFKEAPNNIPAILFQHTADHLDPMVEPRLAHDIHDGAAGPCLGIGATVHQAAYPRQHQRASAHRARL